MKKLTFLLSLVALFATELVYANAQVTSLTGSVQAAAGTAPARVLRQGDIVRQGDTVSTGPASSVVLRFDDGQVAALSSNSRMTVTTYTYNAQSGAGSVLLSLVDGGMRAITGLIGRGSPQQVAYRAANATIGIRGTDISIGTVAGNLAISVTEGGISFTFQGKTTTVDAGEGVDARTDGTVRKAALAAFVASLSPELKAIFSDMDKITLDRLIRQAGQQDLRVNPTGTPSTTSSSSSSGGGGAPSTR